MLFPVRSPPGALLGASFPRRSFLAPQSSRHRAPFGSLTLLTLARVRAVCIGPGS